MSVDTPACEGFDYSFLSQSRTGLSRSRTHLNRAVSLSSPLTVTLVPASLVAASAAPFTSSTTSRTRGRGLLLSSRRLGGGGGRDRDAA